MDNFNLLVNTNSIGSPDKKSTEEESKDISYYEKTTTFIYNKKWLILIGFCILAVLFYIYKYDIPINIPLSFPCPASAFKKKSTNVTCDDITEFDDDKDWNLEEEITKYMELQDIYIKNIDT
jgi:hypothetical protein